MYKKEDDGELPMTDVFSIQMPFQVLPQYEYPKRLASLDPEASEAQPGSVFPEQPLEGDPQAFRFTRSVSEILSEFDGE